MTTIHEMAERWRRLDLRKEVGDAVNENGAAMVGIQIDQLMQGKDNEGNNLMPISKDPFFKSAESAKRYADWKKKLFPETPYDQPNLIITGEYHRGIRITAQGGNIKSESEASFAGSVATKYGNRQLGLSKDSCVLAWRNVLRAPTVMKIANLTGCTVQ